MSRCIDILVLSSNHDKIADRSSGGRQPFCGAMVNSAGAMVKPVWSSGQTGREFWSILRIPVILPAPRREHRTNVTRFREAERRAPFGSPSRYLGRWAASGSFPFWWESASGDRNSRFFAARRSPFQGGTLVNSGEPWSIPERRGPCGANSGQRRVGERRARSNSSCSKAEAMSSCSLRRRPNRDASSRQPLTAAATSAAISRAAEGVIP